MTVASAGPDRRQWRRNQLAMTVATFIGSTGFTLVMPFLPLYFGVLGVEDLGAVAIWSGLSLGITPALTALCAPVWGRLADRFGRKIMVERSLASFVLVMVGLSMATQAWHVLALRALHGVFAGYGSLALAMVAESAPPDRLPTAISLVQMARRLGPAVGPVMGGAFAGAVGLRDAFLVAAGLYGAALLLVLVLYQEADRADAAETAARAGVTFRGALRFPNFPVLMGTIFGLQYVDRSFGPVLPLFVGELGVPATSVPVVSGVLFSVAAGAGALGNHLGSRLLRTRSTRRIVVVSALAGMISVGLLGLAMHVSALYVALPAAAVALGVGTTAAYSAAGRVLPRGTHGVAFGVLSSASLLGLALSPSLSGLLGSVSIRGVFLLDVGILAVLGGLVWRKMRHAEEVEAGCDPR